MTDMLDILPSQMKRIKLSLGNDERLECRDRAFFICGDGYENCVTMEGFGKFSAITGYYSSDGHPQADYSHRMPIRIAHTRAKALCGYWSNWNVIKSPIMNYLIDQDLISRFPNPADRFVFAFKQERKLWKKNSGLPCSINSVRGVDYIPDIKF